MPTPQTSNTNPRSLLRDDVYLSLRDAIIDGTFEPGERLRDQELESWLGVSRTPIREALLRLARAGLVTAKPGRATIVAPVDPKNVSNAQQVAAALHELATRLAGPSVTPEALETMEAANVDFSRALAHEDVDSALRADDVFHGVLTELSGNSMVVEMLEQATPLIRRAERQRFTSMEGRDSVDQHHAIIEHLRVGDVDGAAAVNHQNWMSLHQHLES